MNQPVLRPSASRQHGQTLAEFAISLPLVLILLFGILEFGRMFQSWVTLQNAARTAIRYAVTGQYNSQKYDMDFLIPCYKEDQVMVSSVYQVQRRNANGTLGTYGVNIYSPANGVTPPSQPYDTYGINDPTLLKDDNNNGYARRAYEPYYKGSTLVIDKYQTFTPQAVAALQTIGSVKVIPLNKDESLYSTWYGRDGTDDCTPSSDSDQYRKDMLRLASIYDEARRGASGLALDNSLTGSGSLPEFKKFLFNFWANPSPSQESEGWFNVMICSSRARMYPTTETIIQGNPDDGYSTSNNAEDWKQATSRFYTFRGPGSIRTDNPSQQWGPKDANNADVAYPGGTCLLKEYPTSSNTNMINNYNQPWADAGSAGDRVVVIVTYNHPLITPLGLARFVRMQASRSAVNEAFKVVNAERATGGPGSGSGLGAATDTPKPPTDTPVPSNTPPDTLTPSLTPSVTLTPTKVPFDCAKLYATDVEFSGQSTIYVRLQNDNLDDTVYTRSDIAWNSDRMLTASPNAYAGFISIENQVNWLGYQSTANKTTVSTNAPTQGDSFLVDDPASSTDIYTPGVYITVPAMSSSRWQLTFVGLTKPLSQIMDLWELGGTKIYMLNPDTNKDCAISLTGPAVLTPTPTPKGQVPTATFTPDCADLKYKVAFREFMPNGDVRLQVTSTSLTQVGYFIGFSINWSGARTQIPNLKFLRLTVNGTSANDIPSAANPNGAGTVIWESPTGGETTSATARNQGWKQTFIFPAGKTTDVYLDFIGVGADLLSTRGVSPSVFNGSTLRISCYPNGTGGNGTGGVGGSGDITFDNVNTPTPAGPPTNTITPAPTLPPTKTFTPGPTLTPSNTPKPSNTPVNTNTPVPTQTFTPVPTSTPNFGGCTDRC